MLYYFWFAAQQPTQSPISVTPDASSPKSCLVSPRVSTPQTNSMASKPLPSASSLQAQIKVCRRYCRYLCHHDGLHALQISVLTSCRTTTCTLECSAFAPKQKGVSFLFYRLVSWWWNLGSSTPRTKPRKSRILGFRGKSNTSSLHLILSRNPLQKHFRVEN